MRRYFFAAALALLALGSPNSPAPSHGLLLAQSAQAADKQAPKGQLLDINTASEQALEALPGIGPATAKKIVGGRPYRSKDELVRKKIVSKSTYGKIKDQIVAHRPE